MLTYLDRVSGERRNTCISLARKIRSISSGRGEWWYEIKKGGVIFGI